MSKTTITWLFVAAIAAVLTGIVIGIGATFEGLANHAVVLGGPQLVSLNGDVLAWTIAAHLTASLVIAGGSVAAIAAWVGALLNTNRLDDKTWFAALLLLGLVSLGWVAMIAYVFAGPDSTPREKRRLSALSPTAK
jgi:hypothetical protein